MNECINDRFKRLIEVYWHLSAIASSLWSIYRMCGRLIISYLTCLLLWWIWRQPRFRWKWVLRGSCHSASWVSWGHRSYRLSQWSRGVSRPRQLIFSTLAAFATSSSRDPPLALTKTLPFWLSLSNSGPVNTISHYLFIPMISWAFLPMKRCLLNIM